MPALPPPSGDLDGFDLKILCILANEGRINWNELADRIGLSMTPTIRRVRRLEADGYIKGYGARLNENRLLGPLRIVMTVTLRRHSEEAIRHFKDAALAIPEVITCYMMAGGAEFLVRVAVEDMPDYQRVFLLMVNLPNVGRIDSSFILDMLRPQWKEGSGPVQPSGRSE